MMRWLARIGPVIVVLGVSLHGRPSLAQYGEPPPGVAPPAVVTPTAHLMISEDVPPGAIPPTPVNPYAHVVTTNASQAPPQEWSRPATWRDVRSCPSCTGQNPPAHPFVNRLGLFCWSSHNCTTCSSFASDWHFLWGGCKDFFGEPCINGPPPIPVPPGWGGTPMRAP
jgi:hypothetical protein